MGFLCFFEKRTKTCFFSKNPNLKKQEGWNCLKKQVFLNPDYLSILCSDFPWIARSGTTVVTISLIGRAPYTWSKRPL